MAQVIGGNRIRLNNGQVISAQTGGWYDGRQFWNGSLSSPGQVHPESNQQGAGQNVSAEVNAQSARAQGTTPQAFEGYLESQRNQVAATPAAQQSLPAPAAPAPAPAPTRQVAGEGAGIGYAAPEVPNLPELYETLTKDTGVRQLEAKLSEQEKQYIDAVEQINDNPFLSEATRVGRIAKLDDLFQKRTANLRGDIETKKADVETQLNLQLQQFDINSQASQNALNRFNVLLESGALNNADGTDIANLTRATGLSSSAIKSAVDANRAKDLTTTVQSYDDGVNQGYAILTLDQYGNIVNSQREVIGASTKASSGAGLFSGFSGSESPWEIIEDQISDISSGWNIIGSTTSNRSASSAPPNFTPSGGIGARFRDSAGNNWEFTNQGWVQR